MILRQKFWGDMGDQAKDAIVKLIWAARQASTIEKYGYAIRKLFGFLLIIEGEVVLPLQSAQVAHYLVHLDSLSVSQTAVSTALSAFRWLHGFVPGLNCLNDPLSDQFLTKIANGVSRSQAKAKSRKQPLSEDMVKSILLEVKKDLTRVEYRDALIIAFAYSLLLRADEVTHVNCQHIHKGEEGLKIFIPTSKTDAMRGGQFVFLSKSNSLLMGIFWEYLERVGLLLWQNKFLFPMIAFDFCSNKNQIANRILSYDNYRAIIKKHIGKLGLDIAKFGTHSCRSGGASAIASKVSQYQLLLNGR